MRDLAGRNCAETCAVGGKFGEEFVTRFTKDRSGITLVYIWVRKAVNRRLLLLLLPYADSVNVSLGHPGP